MTTPTHKVLLKQGSLVLKQCKKALLERDMAVLQQQARILQVAAVASRQTLIEAEARLLEQAAQQNQPRRAAEILMKIKECLVALAGDQRDFDSLPGVAAETEAPAKKPPFIQRPHDDSYTKRLGNYLVEAELVTPAQIEVALADQRATGARLGDILVARGWLRKGTIEFIMERVVLPDRRRQEAETPSSPSTSPATQSPRTPPAPGTSVNDRATFIDTSHLNSL
ncbi:MULTISPECIES: hypothetical protein [unclassified Thermosynechococcus]|uniref:hypothetical protein n=1 Tax=unclassified Thermosynechococcus TaxID=2622553 RepID=UPI002672F6BE|nr:MULTISPECIES: hypothetical protein [unclassified Thermosynechococcus]MDR7921337.1 hypothetical protein [Thermosynechococcus sp. HY213]WKT81993.1 hypothetical protein QYC27_04125 [Thermosynechococcus sp. PP45]WNC25607.1 hypothetical protein RHH26_04120 [Thermosynechococcus sp. PP551]WNC28186.1 hypothetical protein RHH27_04120 [Thermosynechococcus sp. PP555]WNC30753.1 hypothetical protein RHH53_04175 [Thermosynechococcus sp. PKX82]